ncbi:MAG: homocysteine S-methyltransferase family protein [Alphaproteobacteria bacterium]|nr:homocysteine S-methyltransferase family protein [Alphaproteobacteria bacterium]
MRRAVPAGETLVLDGGMGRELKRRGVPIPKMLWSVNALLVAPEAVRATHADFIRAGADVIIANNYMVVPSILEKAGIGERLEELLRLAGKLAVEAREESGRAALVAGSLSPLMGRPEDVPLETLAGIYGRIAQTMAPYVDLFVGETLSSAMEGRAAALGAASAGKPVWIAWGLHDDASGRLRSGESVADAVDAVADLDVEAILFNCCTPESIDAVLPQLRSKTDRLVGAYANAFKPTPEEWTRHEVTYDMREDMEPETYAGFARRWLGTGMRLIGGCCGMGPEHIARLRELVPQAKGIPG